MKLKTCLFPAIIININYVVLYQFELFKVTSVGMKHDLRLYLELNFIPNIAKHRVIIFWKAFTDKVVILTKISKLN